MNILTKMIPKIDYIKEIHLYTLELIQKGYNFNEEISRRLGMPAYFTINYTQFLFNRGFIKKDKGGGKYNRKFLSITNKGKSLLSYVKELYKLKLKYKDL